MKYYLGQFYWFEKDIKKWKCDSGRELEFDYEKEVKFFIKTFNQNNK